MSYSIAGCISPGNFFYDRKDKLTEITNKSDHVNSNLI